MVKDVTNTKNKGVQLNLTKAVLASFKATLMSLMYTVIRKLFRVIYNERRNTATLKLVAAQVLTLENPLVLESASDNIGDYLDKEFRDVSNKDGGGQARHKSDGGDKFVGDHSDGDLENDDEEEVERIEPYGLEYKEGDD